MNEILKAHIQSHLADPLNATSTLEILRLRPQGKDFSDELIDSFAPKDRASLYLMLQIWCKSTPMDIIRKRLNVEPDRFCRKVLEKVLSGGDV